MICHTINVYEASIRHTWYVYVSDYHIPTAYLVLVYDRRNPAFRVQVWKSIINNYSVLQLAEIGMEFGERCRLYGLRKTNIYNVALRLHTIMLNRQAKHDLTILSIISVLNRLATYFSNAMTKGHRGKLSPILFPERARRFCIHA